MDLCFLPDDGRMGRPKRVVGKLNESKKINPIKGLDRP
jgi:hypothetical protein